ncbi:hypothetical protein SCLCIDRAFT_617095 [Scleroderma citrinum Foug A]|uniref:Uncharacterized protein n=1 Tax=Scleroderma citrinum Foug A TaxID=1036808 RepID=A0A0C3CSY7_9AGAM|nr:hypothetical protein SCLCIDRAFT_617095 [Scleroderma citrinum Foug A]
MLVYIGSCCGSCTVCFLGHRAQRIQIRQHQEVLLVLHDYQRASRGGPQPSSLSNRY